MIKNMAKPVSSAARIPIPIKKKRSPKTKKSWHLVIALSVFGAVYVNQHVVKLSTIIAGLGVGEIVNDLLQLLGCLDRTDCRTLPRMRVMFDRCDAALLETLFNRISQSRASTACQ